ncbi:MAG: carboxypeptidase regulatory-like domain-containing protein [Asgard group archaeon]|nr:carboxypeptidase regulatory-like domain-containing protein [Asgard group archaeon]
MKMKKGFSFIVLVITIAGMMTALVKVQGYSTFQGTVEDRDGNPLSYATIVLADCYSYILGWDTTDSEGDYSFSVTLNGNSPYKLSATKTGFITGVKENIYSEGTYDFVLGEKIAVFFYADDAANLDIIDEYMDILEDEHFTKFFEFRQSVDVESDCQTVADYEIEEDTIFVYIWAHGIYDDEEEYSSLSYFKSLQNSPVYSFEFKGYMDDWDAERKCLLVESCYSGTWAKDFAESPYLAMSSSDETHESKFMAPWEGKFSHYFFEHVEDGYTAVQSFYYAENYCDAPYNQYPVIRDYSSYVWFNY